MPTYEYLCTSCNNQWEEIQRISEAPVEVCPKCQKATARRQISGGTFILKGGGWYADLYSSSAKKSDKSEKSEKSEKGHTNGPAAPSASGDAKSETKSESKGEAKSDAKPDAKPSSPPPAKTPAKTD